jgi:hypothetical protein
MRYCLWYRWKSSVIPQAVPVPQFYNRWSRANCLCVTPVVFIMWNLVLMEARWIWTSLMLDTPVTRATHYMRWSCNRICEVSGRCRKDKGWYPGASNGTPWPISHTAEDATVLVSSCGFVRLTSVSYGVWRLGSSPCRMLPFVCVYHMLRMGWEVWVCFPQSPHTPVVLACLYVSFLVAYCRPRWSSGIVLAIGRKICGFKSGRGWLIVNAYKKP